MENLPLVRPLIYPTAVFIEETGWWEATSPTAPGRIKRDPSGRAAKLALWAEMIDEIEESVNVMEDTLFDRMENPPWAG